MKSKYGVERVTATSQVVNSIRAAIQRGEYKVGDRLPNEQELCQLFAVGRSSLREGMRILSAYGIVEIRQGEGTFVTDNYEERVFEFLGFMPESTNLHYLMDLREIIEVGCIRLICQQRDETAFEALSEIAGKINMVGGAEDNIQADKAFHIKMVELTQNPLTLRIYKMMSKLQSLLMTQLMYREDVLSDAITSHDKICDALKVFDEEACAFAVKQHIDQIRNYIKLYIPEH